MRTLIIGADGQLGTDLCKVIPKVDQIPLTVKDIDITDKVQTIKVIKQHAPEVVINTAAYNLVDDSEEHQSRAFLLNAQGVQNVVDACLAIDSAMVHISTDYVFDGSKGSPYIETDTPDPQSVYARSKLEGELKVQAGMHKYYIVRSSGLYGTAGSMGKGGGNFVETMIAKAKAQTELKVVADEVTSPTYTLDLAGKIFQLAQTGRHGLYHIVNRGECSWYEFAGKIFEYLGTSVKVLKTSAAEFNAKAKRPKYSALRNANLAKIGLDDMRPWQEALKAYLMEKGHLR